jgi:hypothetical protein
MFVQFFRYRNESRCAVSLDLTAKGGGGHDTSYYRWVSAALIIQVATFYLSQARDDTFDRVTLENHVRRFRQHSSPAKSAKSFLLNRPLHAVYFAREGF